MLSVSNKHSLLTSGWKINVKSCSQQFQILGIRPWYEAVVERRADRLAKKFPQYDPEIIELYSETEPLWNNVLLRHPILQNVKSPNIIIHEKVSK